MSDPSSSTPGSAVAPDASSPVGVGLVESARRLGHYAWIEERLFEVLGGWVQETAEPDVKLHLATHGPRHAWHAQLWRERFPSVHELDVDHAVAPPGDALVSFVAALAEPTGGALTIEKLVGVHRVAIPHLIATYTRHQVEAAPVADGPVLRALGFVVADEVEAWREGEVLLQSLVRSDGDVERAIAHQARLQRLLLDAGGVTGATDLGR